MIIMWSLNRKKSKNWDSIMAPMHRQLVLFDACAHYAYVINVGARPSHKLFSSCNRGRWGSVRLPRTPCRSTHFFSSDDPNTIRDLLK